MSNPVDRLLDNLRFMAKDVRDERLYGILGRGRNYTEITAPRKNEVWITLENGNAIALPNIGSGHVPERSGLRVRMIRRSNGALVLDGQDDRFMQDDSHQPNSYGVLPHPFTSHTDVPTSYDSQAGKVVRVNSDEDELEFHTLTTSDVAEGSNLYYTDERARDAIATALVQGSNVTITVDDAGNTITIAAATGGFGGNSVQYVFSTTITDADPGSGKVRFNNATFASITRIYIDDLDANANDVQTWINALDDSTSSIKGYLLVFKKSDPSVYRIFNISAALTDPGGYTKITVSPIVTNGTLVDTDPVVISFARTGDKGDTGATGTAGTNGTNGTNGATGTQGGFGGNSQEYKYSTTITDADPGSGLLRFDNATFASITKIFIDDNNNAGTDVQAWIDSLDDSNSSVKGHIRIFKESDSSIFRVFKITSTHVDPGGYTKIAVAPIAQAGSLANNDVVVVSFVQTGDAGNNGNDGAPGATGGTGATGAQGGFGGDSMEYKFSTTITDADPGSGFVRFNNATFASITQLFIDDLDNSGNDVQAWINSLDDSNSSIRGTLRVFKESDFHTFAVFNITGAEVDPGGYTKIAVTPIIAVGTLANNDVVVLTFSRAGNIPTGTLLADGTVALTADWIAGAARAITIGTLIGSAATGGNLTLKSSSHATPGKILFGAAGASGYDEVNNLLAIGAADPVSQIESVASSSATNRGTTASQHNSGAQAAVFNFRKSRGSRASQTTVVNADFIGDFVFQPFDGTNYLRTANIAAKVNGTVAAGSVPTDLIFATGATDDSGLANEVMRLNGSGEIITGNLDVAGLVTAAGAGAHTMERTTAATNTLNGAEVLKATSSNNMVDGFGTGFLYEIRDNAAVDNVIGITGAIRNGADNTGALTGFAYLAGVAKQVYWFDSNFQVFLNGLTSGNANSLGIKPGTSSNDAAVGGVLTEITTQTGNVGAGEDDLASYSVPANTLSANGMSLWFEAFGTFANNLNAKRIRVQFTAGSGTTLVFDLGSGNNFSNQYWHLRGRIVRTGAATQKGSAMLTTGVNGGGPGSAAAFTATGLNQTLSGAVTLKVTGEATSNNDVVIESFTVGWDDANT